MARCLTVFISVSSDRCDRLASPSEKNKLELRSELRSDRLASPSEKIQDVGITIIIVVITLYYISISFVLSEDKTHR
jgi:hypothetical protein